MTMPPLSSVDRNGPLPVSFAQGRLWFLDQLEPGYALYNVPASVRLTGDLDISALERALNEVVRRHEALRTTFAAEGGIPRQAVAPQMAVPLTIEDLSGRPQADREASLLESLRAEASRPFDLARGPLVRAMLVRVDPADHVAIVTMHAYRLGPVVGRRCDP